MRLKSVLETDFTASDGAFRDSRRFIRQIPRKKCMINTRMKQYNFSSLQSLRVVHWWRYFSPGLVLTVCWVLASILFDQGDTNFLWLLFAGLGATFIGAIWLVIVMYRAEKSNQAVLQRFAQENSLAYEYKPETKLMGESSLFRYGYSRTRTHVLAGTSQQLPFELFQYRYTEGQGKSSRTYYQTVAAVDLPHEMAHFIIDSLVESGSGRVSVLPITFAASQKLTLEGDFSHYFALYAPDKHAVDALTILAPDVMQVLLEKNALCDIEIIGKKLYFYWPLQAKTAADYEMIFSAFEAVMAQVAPPLKRLHTSSSVVADAGTVQATQPPARLRDASRYFSILAILVVIILISSPYPQFAGFALLGFVIVMIIAGIVQSILRRRRYNRLRRRYISKEF